VAQGLKQLSKQCGMQDQSTAFVTYEGQILLLLQIEDFANLATQGDIPLLFSSEDIQLIKLEVQGSEIQPYDNYSELFIQRLRRNLHTVLVMSPSGTVYCDICIRFPVILPDCLVDWCMP
jgi:hypothetical protein